MKPPFDIAGDLDTPVSAYAKLASFQPRFLLESVEGGERLGRYSFIGFGAGPSVAARRALVPRFGTPPPPPDTPPRRPRGGDPENLGLLPHPPRPAPQH